MTNTTHTTDDHEDVDVFDEIVGTLPLGTCKWNGIEWEAIDLDGWVVAEGDLTFCHRMLQERG